MRKRILIQRQRELARVGNIRIGIQVPNRSGKGSHPAYLSEFRFTSPNKAAIEKLAGAYGGTPRPWSEMPGQTELFSTVNQIRVIIDTRLSVSEEYCLYDGKTKSRSCDGCTCRHLDVQRDPQDAKKVLRIIDNGEVACMCDPAGEGVPDRERKCQVDTTARFLLPDSGDVTVWQLRSKGATFNKEVFALVDMLEESGITQSYCLLTIHEAEGLAPKAGNPREMEKVKFAVPRLSLDPNPPNFAAMLLANTPAAQVRALAASSPQLQAASAGSLPRPVRSPREEKAIDILRSRGWLAKEFAPNLADFKVSCSAEALDWVEVLIDADGHGHATWEALSEYVKQLSEGTIEVQDSSGEDAQGPQGPADEEGLNI